MIYGFQRRNLCRTEAWAYGPNPVHSPVVTKSCDLSPPPPPPWYSILRKPGSVPSIWDFHFRRPCRTRLILSLPLPYPNYFLLQHESFTAVLSQPLHSWLHPPFLSHSPFLSQPSFLSQEAHFSSEHFVASLAQPSASPHEFFLSQFAHCSVEHLFPFELLLHEHETTAAIAAAINTEINIFFMIKSFKFVKHS